MATGDRIYIADKETLDKVKGNTEGILSILQDEDGYFGGRKRFGVKINKNDSNPATRVTYLFDAVGMQPAFMDFANGVFDYGDFGDAWFVKGNRVVMLKYDGTEDYEIDPNDYRLKKGGTKTAIAAAQTLGGIFFDTAYKFADYSADATIASFGDGATLTWDADTSACIYTDGEGGTQTVYSGGAWAFPCVKFAAETTVATINGNAATFIESGYPSDAYNPAYNGNVMATFPTVWLNQYEIGGYEYIIACAEQYDSSYKAYAHQRADDSIMDVKYLAAFVGYYDGARLRSLAGFQPMYNQNAATEISRAAANNVGDAEIWTTRAWCDRNMVNCLLTIMCKSDNTQAAYGQGNSGGYSEALAPTYGVLKTGTLFDKGQFFGYSDTTHQVKVFHMEKWWGDQWERLQGLVADRGVVKVKMTKPYNLTGAGFTEAGIKYVGESGGYIKETKMSDLGRLPVSAGGSASTYLCDYLYWRDSVVAVALVGGFCRFGAYCGASYVYLDHAASGASWGLGAALSCERPLTA